MAASTSFLVNDSSSYANYFSWASAIHTALTTGGWIQTNDTGQVMWSGMSITAVSMSGSNMTCTYSSGTGLALQVGSALTVTGWTGGNTGNNGTFVITGVTGGPTTGTWTAVNAAGVNVASGGTGVVTAQSTVPGSNSYLYEIWTPNDSLTAFYLKMEYGNWSSSGNAPMIAATLGTATTGSGFVSGYTTSRFVAGTGTPGTLSSTVPYECRFGCGTSYFGCMMWRTATNNNGQLVMVERSVNSSGAYTNSHVTLVVVGGVSTGNTMMANQQTLTLGGNGVAPAHCTTQTGNSQQGLAIRVPNTRGSVAFNGAVPFDTVAPYIGYYDYPLLGLGGASFLSVSEGQLITVSVYGSNHNYICTQNFPFSQFAAGMGSAGNSLCMRYE